MAGDETQRAWGHGRRGRGGCGKVASLGLARYRSVSKSYRPLATAVTGPSSTAAAAMTLPEIIRDK